MKYLAAFKTKQMKHGQLYYNDNDGKQQAKSINKKYDGKTKL